MVHKNIDLSNISGLSTNSKTTKQGECFFAIKGSRSDGNIFIDEAIANGANLAITSDTYLGPNNDKIIQVDDVNETLAFCAQQFYTNLPEYKLAITGTNGKTSTADYCRQIFALLGYNSASIGTIGVISNVKLAPEIYNLATLTSNDLISNYKILTELKSNGVDHVALEVSSIGMDQQRFNKCYFHAAAFVSFASDHLDYHKNLEEYLDAKLKLFEQNLNNNAPVFISQDVEKQILKYNRKLSNYEVIGSTPSCDLYIHELKSDLYGQKVVFIYKNHHYSFYTNIIGRFQAENLLFAIMLSHRCGLDLNQIIDIIPKIKAVKGRLEKVPDINKDRCIFIDYAHNPDALEQIILELRKLKPAKSKIYTVFGCGGDRDKLKRPIMGAIAAKLSDYVIITDDNPRSENPQQIRDEIIGGIKSNNYIEIANREEAIKYSLSILEDYDIMLIAGKGHEEYQIHGNIKTFFSDAKIVNKYLFNYK
jgi:UDP-N-acetylmuramoyl-L-alanyl-D-glutamate--2,6-diaminopimelate ligase